MTYDVWLSKKREQQLKERDYQKKLKELQTNDSQHPATLEERQIVFRRLIL